MITLILLLIPLQQDSVRQAPRRLVPGEHGIGRRIAEVAPGDRAIVITLQSPACPIGKKYGPTVERLKRTYAAKKVAFVSVDSGGPEAAALGAMTTTDVFVLDAARTLVYRGAIDDQYGLGYSLDAPGKNYLIEALEAVLAGRLPEVQATWAPGCALDPPKAPVRPTEVTYHGRVSRILQNACVECHRKGGLAPFGLESHDEVIAHAGMIAKVVESGTMPPWFAAAPKDGEVSPWVNDRSLAPKDKSDLLAWLKGGRPVGSAGDAPLPRKFPESWRIGTPDAIVQIPKPIDVKAEGTMPYQNVRVETSFAEDRWVQGLEVLPTAPEVVHHALVFAISKGDLLDERGGFFAAYVPGNSAIFYPEGYAKRLPAGATLRFQIHYTPNGKAARDQAKLGLVFSKKPPDHSVRVIGIADPRLRIPPGAENHPESATLPVIKDAVVLGFMPHMHLRGKAFRYELFTPDGKSRVMLDVPRYDFNWQLAYRLADPLSIPKGSRIVATGWYDNSRNNPANPDPTKTVRWGPQTGDEMMLGYVEYYFPDEDRP